MNWTFLTILSWTVCLFDLRSDCLPFTHQNSLDDYDFNSDNNDGGGGGGSSVQQYSNEDPFSSFKFEKIDKKLPKKGIKDDEKIDKDHGNHDNDNDNNVYASSFDNFEQLKKRIQAVKGDHGIILDVSHEKESEVIDDIAEVLKALNLPADFANGNHTDETNLTATADSKKVDVTLSTSSSSADQLAALGSHSHGYSYSTGSLSHGHGLFGLGHTSFGHHGYGHQGLGGAKGDILSQLIQLLLAIPSAKLKLLKPLILGFADTAAQATHVAAGVNAHLAKSLPHVIRVKADILHKLLDTFGDATGSLLYILSQLLSVAASAKQHFSATSLPHLLDVLGYKSEIVASALGEAATVKGKVVSTLVKGGHQLTAGVVEGIQNVVGHHYHHNHHHDHHEHHPPSPPIYSNSYGEHEAHHYY